MSDTSFRFRQFTIHQDKCAMKVGTDAIVLGAWINLDNIQRVLDIGTGTGLIALMLAQKSRAEIDAIDIDENAFQQARENFRISPWFSRLNIFHSSFQDFAESTNGLYDLIITNPPYFHHASKPTEESRINARHTDSLTFSELIQGTKKLLKPEGRFCVILPCKEGSEFMNLAQKQGLFCNHLVRIRTRSDKSEKRLIMEFGFRFGIMTDEEITILDEMNAYTEEYINLTKEYFIDLRAVHSHSL